MESKKSDDDRGSANLVRLLPFFLASLLIAVLLFSFGAVGGAQALANTLYVDHASGTDSGNCQTSGSPCKTINYAIGQAGIGDSILIAGGTYTENVIVNQAVSLMGGYEASGWTRDLSFYMTIIDANDSGRPVTVNDNQENVTLDGVKLIGGNTTEDGGGIYITGGSVDILNSQIDSNNTSACCGGIHVGNSATLAITNTEVTWNISGEAGAGGIGIFSGSVVTITNSDISYNVTSGSSGGIFVEFAQVYAKNTTFTYNEADTDGGALGAYNGSTTTLEYIEAAFNKTGVVGPPGHGSGLYFRNGAQGVVVRADIHDNDGTECGAGIRVDDPPTFVAVSETKIYDNQANCGGGISVNQGWLTLMDSNVQGNEASGDGGNGGGLHLTDGGRIDVTDSEISDNTTTDHGGAVSAGDATVNITNTLITGNVATTGNANVLALGDSNVTIMNTTVADNNPTGAQAVILWGGTMTMTNSIMWNNSLSFQSECVLCSFVVNYSDIQGLDGIPDISSGVGNFDADPLFAGLEMGGYHLTPNSPCIDKGTTAGAPILDIEGNPRTPPPDVGAFEWIGTKIFLPMVVKK